LPVAAGTTAVLTTEFDTKGYEGIMGLAVVTPATSGATAKLTAYSAASTTATFIAIDGSSASVTAQTTTWVLASDVYKPVDRYVRFKVTRSTSNTVLEGGVALFYGPKKSPVTWSTSTTSIARTVSATSS